MPGMSRYLAQRTLEWSVGKTAMPTLPSGFLALFTTLPNDDGTGGVEVTGGAYARVSFAGAAWGVASSTDPVTITNSGALIQFATPTVAWGTVVGFGIFDAITGGNLLWADYLGNFAWQPFSCTLASPGVLTVPAHGYSNGDTAVVTAELGGTLPTTGGSWAGLKTVAGVTTDTFNLGTNTTSTGNGQVRKVVAQIVSINTQVTFNTSQLILSVG